MNLLQASRHLIIDVMIYILPYGKLKFVFKNALDPAPCQAPSTSRYIGFCQFYLLYATHHVNAFDFASAIFAYANRSSQSLCYS